MPSTRPSPNDAWTAALRRVLDEPARRGAALQPVVDLASGRVTGHEVLARFPEAPRVPVRAWFDAAGRLGLSGALEVHAVHDALTLRAQLAVGTFVAVNLSPMALTSAEVGDALSGGRLDGLVVELLDRDDGAHPAMVRDMLRDLEERGAAIALDDAGGSVGASARVGAVRPRYVKVDGTLVRSMAGDPARGELVAALLELGERLGAVLVAKGVETEEQLEALRRLRVPLGQGLLLGPPAPVPQLERTPSAPEPDAPTAPPHGTVGTGVGVLRERITTARAAEGAAGAFAAEPHAAHVLLVDDAGRAVGLAERGADARGEQPRPPLVLRPSVGLADAAERAMARPRSSRFDPLVVVDPAGVALAAVPVERLVAALAALG